MRTRTTLGLALAALLLWLSSPAQAISVAGLDIDPVYLNGPQSGSAGPGAFGTEDSSMVGRSVDLSISDFSEVLMEEPGGFGIDFTPIPNVVRNNPQASSGTVSSSNPFVADAVWDISNAGSTGWSEAYLLIMRVLTYDGHPSVADPMEVGFDADYGGMQFLDDPFSTSEQFIALPLGAVGPGGSSSVDVRYVINDILPLDGPMQLLPPIGVLVVANLVPEPGTLLLFGTALVLAGIRRRA